VQTFLKDINALKIALNGDLHSDEMVLEAAVNVQVQAIVTYNLRDFVPAKLFGIPVINPQQAFVMFDLQYPLTLKESS
jgi:hypothetical protein